MTRFADELRAHMDAAEQAATDIMMAAAKAALKANPDIHRIASAQGIDVIEMIDGTTHHLDSMEDVAPEWADALNAMSEYHDRDAGVWLTREDI